MANVLITGASRGIGLEFVKQFINYSKKPSNIIALCRDPLNAKALNEVAANSDNVSIIKADMTDFDGYKNIVSEVQDVVQSSGLHLLVNNAGIMIKDTLKTVQKESIVNSFELNAVAPLLFTRALLPILKSADEENSLTKVGKSMVVNISAHLGSVEENTTSGYISYRLSKVALNMATKTLAIDLKSLNIFVLAFYPGWVRTDMGGSNAPMSVENSVKNMLTTISKVQEENRGMLLHYKGARIPW